MTKFYRSSESGTEELVLTPRATDEQVEAAARASWPYVNEHDCWDSEHNQIRKATHRDCLRAALAAAQAVAPAKGEKSMHPLALKEVVKVCRQREREGDCPITPALSVEVLEDAVVSLASQLQIALDPDIETDAGAAHWEAPPAPAPWPTEEQVAEVIRKRADTWMVNTPVALDIAREVDALYRNVLFPKVQP
jgi:hypothetical protein